MATGIKSTFYICVSIHEASSDAQDFSALYEERLTLIEARSKAEAMQKAQQMVKMATHTYKNENGDTISWKCRRVVHVTEMADGALVDGAEIYGRYFRDLDVYERLESELGARM
jgi:Domain of unknown function (DUF4288)